MKKKFKFLAIIIAILTIFLTQNSVLNVYAKEINEVYLGGFTAGFTLKTKGATVIGINDVICDNEISSPSKLGGIKVGDIILSLNGTPINDLIDIENYLKNYKENEEVLCEISRNGHKKFLSITPKKDINGNYKLGVFIRNDLNGLGTITYIDKEGNFASLGHPVNNDKGEILKIVSGEVYDSSIIGVIKAHNGKPGELKGLFLGDESIGKITKNTKTGMYGKLYNFNENDYTKIKIGEPTIGKAQIVSTVDGKNVKYYNVELIKTSYFNSTNKNIVIKITDEELLSYTGGILQGMSGSPIIQKGKLVGAITHVFINDSSRGYGISINNMINNQF